MILERRHRRGVDKSGGRARLGRRIDSQWNPRNQRQDQRHAVATPGAESAPRPRAGGASNSPCVTPSATPADDSARASRRHRGRRPRGQLRRQINFSRVSQLEIIEAAAIVGDWLMFCLSEQ